MPQKRITIDLTFDEVTDEFDEDYTYLELKEVGINERLTTATPDQMQSVGESAGQSDFYQITVNNLIWEAVYTQNTYEV